MAISESKWTKYRVLRANPTLAGALPDTRLFSRQALFALLDQYRKAVAKPAAGSGGAGIIMVSGLRNGRYRVHRGAGRRMVRGKSNAFRHVRSKVRSPYLVQRGISLARINGRPFDVRVMVQRHKGSPWVVTGMLAKVAGRGYIITNIKRSGGRVLPLRTAIERSTISWISPDAVIESLSSIALLAAETLATYYTHQQVFGLDMGIDTTGKVWIIEANLRPDTSLFLKLADRQMYHTIRSYR